MLRDLLENLESLVIRAPREKPELKENQEMMVSLESPAKKDLLVISERTEKRETKAL